MQKLSQRKYRGHSLLDPSNSPSLTLQKSRSRSVQTNRNSASSTASIYICSSHRAASAATTSKSKIATSSAEPPCSSTVDSCRISKCSQSIPRLSRLRLNKKTLKIKKSFQTNEQKLIKTDNREALKKIGSAIGRWRTTHAECTVVKQQGPVRVDSCAVS